MLQATENNEASIDVLEAELKLLYALQGEIGRRIINGSQPASAVDGTVLTADAIHQGIERLATQLKEKFQDAESPPILVGLMDGAGPFLEGVHSALARQGCYWTKQTMKAKSYEETAPGELSILSDLVGSIQCRPVIVIDDIVDTGQTLSRLKAHLESKRPASVHTAVLLDKQDKRASDADDPDFSVFKIPDVFVIGFGMDCDDYARCLPGGDICVARDEDLVTDLERQQLARIKPCLDELDALYLASDENISMVASLSGFLKWNGRDDRNRETQTPSLDNEYESTL